jgi:hypothetical protein
LNFEYGEMTTIGRRGPKPQRPFSAVSVFVLPGISHLPEVFPVVFVGVRLSAGDSDGLVTPPRGVPSPAADRR